MAETLRLAIEQEARRLGFDWVGVTTPQPPPHWMVYSHWLAQGRHGEMAYLASDRARQRRANPRQILAECRSILLLGIPYEAPQNPELSQPDHPASVLRGRLAAYAWGEDYHDVLAERLGLLMNFIEAKSGTPVLNRWYSDTGPVLERPRS